MVKRSKVIWLLSSSVIGGVEGNRHALVTCGRHWRGICIGWPHQEHICIMGSWSDKDANFPTPTHEGNCVHPYMCVYAFVCVCVSECRVMANLK